MHFHTMSEFLLGSRVRRSLCAGICAVLSVLLAAAVMAPSGVMAGGLGLAGESVAEQLDAGATLDEVMLAAMLRRDASKVDVSRFAKNYDEFSEVTDGLLKDHYELVDVSDNVQAWTNNNGIVVYAEPSLPALGGMDDAQLLDVRRRVMEGVADAMSWIPADGSDMEKVRAAHDWLCAHAVADSEEATHPSPYESLVHGAHGPLVTSSDRPFPYNVAGSFAGSHAGVCSSHAESFKLLMDLLGIDCQIVTATDHGWNLVRVGDRCYHVDVTYDAAQWDKLDIGQDYVWGPDNKLSHSFFLKSDEGIVLAELDECFGGIVPDNPETSLAHPGSYSFERAMDASASPYDGMSGKDWDTQEHTHGVCPQNVVSDFSLNASEVAIEPGRSFQLAVEAVTPVNANKLMATWYSSNPSVAEVCANGQVLAMGEEGTATITCRMRGVERTCVVSVGDAGKQVVEQREPSFKKSVVDTSGRIGLGLRVELPEASGIDWTTSQLKVHVDGKSARDLTLGYADAVLARGEEGDDVATFVVPLTTIEMAQPVHATFCYEKDGVSQKIEKREVTLEKVIDAQKTDAKICDAIANLGFVAQRYFSGLKGWKLGVDYTAMTQRSLPAYDKDATLNLLAGAEIKKDLGSSAVKKITANTRLESATELDVNVYLKRPVNLEGHASVAGRTLRPEKVNDTLYRFRVSGIAAQDLMRDVAISGDAEGAFSITLSPMAYVKCLLASNTQGAQGDNTMCALVDYYQAVKDQPAA